MPQVDVSDAQAVLARFDDRLRDRPVRPAPADDQDVAVGVEVRLGGIESVGDAPHLLGARAHHLLVVLRVVADVAGESVLLQSADPVLEAGRSRNGPRPRELLVALVREESRRVGGDVRIDLRKAVHVGKQPRFAAIRQRTVGEEDHRRAAIDGDPARLVGGVEAVGRRT